MRGVSENKLKLIDKDKIGMGRKIGMGQNLVNLLNFETEKDSQKLTNYR